MPQPVALITGCSQRIGAEIARRLHAEGYSIAVHYRSSESSADALCNELNALRAHSASAFSADLLRVTQLKVLADQVLARFGRLDALINNASDFFPTPMGSVTESDWDRLIGSNVKGAFFLSQAFVPALKLQAGCIINIVDIYADKPLQKHPVYSIAKAGLAMMTKSLALELGPEVRVNGVAPGAILWPEGDAEYAEQEKHNVATKVPLARKGEASDIANTVRFLLIDAPYISGQIVAVDGGRSVVF